MNEHEIKVALQRISEDVRTGHDEHLLKGAQFLSDFCDLINDISDGWPYWSYGTKCSSDLQEIVSRAQWPAKRLTVTAEAVAAACEKIRRFLKQCNQTKDKPRVLEFLNPKAKAPTPARQPDSFKSFRVVSASSNTNGFGLRGYVLVAQDGEAWEVGRSDDANRCVAPEFKRGADITVRVTADGPEFPACEIPEALPTCPPEVVKEIYGASPA